MMSELGGICMLKVLIKLLGADSPNKMYFLKMQSKNICLQTHPMDAVSDVWDTLTTDESMALLFVLPPFVLSKIGLVLMHD